jgi:hypothetical protein
MMKKAVQLIVDSLSHLLIIERAILDKSAAINDEGSNAMMSDFISEQEKTIWMMQAWKSNPTFFSYHNKSQNSSLILFWLFLMLNFSNFRSQ